MSWCPHLRTDLERKNRGVLHLKGLLLTISLAREYPHCFFLSSHFFCKQSKKGNFILAAALADEVFIWSSEHICIQPHAVSALSDSIQDKKKKPQKNTVLHLVVPGFFLAHNPPTTYNHENKLSDCSSEWQQHHSNPSQKEVSFSAYSTVVWLNCYKTHWGCKSLSVIFFIVHCFFLLVIP